MTNRRKVLEGKRDELLRRVAEYVNLPLEKLPDIFDAAQEELLRFCDSEVHRKELDLLNEVDQALERCIVGDYGTCLECGEPISEKRLDAIPWARYCVPCKTEMDRMEEAA